MSQPQKNKDKRGGFTLVELMVAMSLLAVIMVALMMAFQQAQRAFRLGANQVDVLENSRALSSLFSRQMQEMAASETPYGLNFYTTNVAYFSMPLPNGAQDMQLQRLFFLTRHGDQARAYNYVLAPKAQNTQVATLYCREFSARLGGCPEALRDTNVFDDRTFYAELNADLWTNYHRVADGVVHLVAQPLDTNSAVYFVTNSTPELANSSSPLGPYWCYTFGYTNLPSFVDLEIGVLDPQTLKQLETRLMPDPTGGMAQTYLLQKSAKVYLFRQRIPIRGKGRLDT